MQKPNQLFENHSRKMLSAKLPDIVIRSFEYYFKQLVEGATGNLPEKTISEVKTLPDAFNLQEKHLIRGHQEMSRTVMIKLNGGLGTGMGLEKAKSLLEVKNGLTFLDIIAKQAINQSVPLILMNSFATREDSLARIREKHPQLKSEVPLDFIQHKIPKIRQSDLSPAEYPENPFLEWCPPGHGDIYTALVTSGLLETLLEKGFKTAFVSNSDNLGASLDPSILGYFTSGNYGFMMEVADRTQTDRKGGHLAILKKTGSFVLRESAQCPKEDMDQFQNIRKHKYFNTNNLWIHLETLDTLLKENGGYLQLPLIRNSKPINPTVPSSYPVFQLETAMGAAISTFPNPQAIRVKRDRFLPVKTTADLMVISSDATTLAENFLIQVSSQRVGPLPKVSLDPRYYMMVTDLEEHFTSGPPSLVNCKTFRVEGRIQFGKNVIIRGETQLVNQSEKPVVIADDSILEGRYSY